MKRNMKDYEVEVTGKDGKNYIRTKCQVWTRVMGYIRPTASYNKGKLQEYKDRKRFTEERVNNSRFKDRFAVTK